MTKINTDEDIPKSVAIISHFTRSIKDKLQIQTMYQSNFIYKVNIHKARRKDLLL